MWYWELFQRSNGLILKFIPRIFTRESLQMNTDMCVWVCVCVCCLLAKYWFVRRAACASQKIQQQTLQGRSPEGKGRVTSFNLFDISGQMNTTACWKDHTHTPIAQRMANRWSVSCRSLITNKDWVELLSDDRLATYQSMDREDHSQGLGGKQILENVSPGHLKRKKKKERERKRDVRTRARVCERERESIVKFVKYVCLQCEYFNVLKVKNVKKNNKAEWGLHSVKMVWRKNE